MWGGVSKKDMGLFSLAFFFSPLVKSQTDNMCLSGLYPQSMHCKLLLKFKTIAQESLKNELMSSAASIHYLNPVQPSPARVTESLWSSISLESAWSFPGIFLFCEVALKSWCKGTLLGLWLCTWPSSLLQLLFSSGRETCACRFTFSSAYPQAATAKCYWGHKGWHKDHLPLWRRGRNSTMYLGACGVDVLNPPDHQSLKGEVKMLPVFSTNGVVGCLTLC